MSKYTTTIYYLKNNGFDFELNEYPIFDENYRETLNNLILDNFLMDEIGFETPALFRHFLKTKMNEIMPYYNTLYKLQAQMIQDDNLFGNVNLREEFNRNIEQTTESNGQSTSSNTQNNSGSNKSVFQNTPQGNLKNQDINNYSYATNVTLDGGTSTGTTNGNVNDHTTSNGSNLENYIKTITGNNGKMYNIELITKALDSFRNINTKLLSELEELFMGVY